VREDVVICDYSVKECQHNIEKRDVGGLSRG
jgi:hypothetical protein